MCRPKPHINKSHPLFREFPLLANTRCLKATIYRRMGASKVVCVKCYNDINRPSDMQRGVCHAAVFGDLKQVTCEVCQNPVNVFDSINNCNECFICLLDSLRYLKDRGVEINDITRFILNIIAGTIINITITEIPETQGINTDLLDHM